MLEKEFMEKLESTIDNLPEKQREVFLMNRIEKMKYKEIALHLDISVKAVEKRMHQALVVMRKEIGDRWIWKTTSDTEVLLAAWSIWREECLNKLVGMFAFIILDNKYNIL